MLESFEKQLTGGHPNSLGNTVAVVDQIFADPARLAELYDCYFSDDPVVRLRVSNAMKRICKEQPDWLVPYVPRFLEEISTIDQASTQWTFAQLFQSLTSRLSDEQREAATNIIWRNLQQSDDWIVLNTSMVTLTDWVKKFGDNAWRERLQQRLGVLSKDSRKSVAGRAAKMLKLLEKSAKN